MENKEMYLEFSLDYDGLCEVVDTFEVGDEDLTDEVDFDDVDEFVKELDKLEGFSISEHRTEVQVWWKGGKMEVVVRYFTEPDEGEFEVTELKKLDPIEFTF